MGIRVWEMVLEPDNAGVVQCRMPKGHFDPPVRLASRTTTFLEPHLQDLKYGVRTLRNNPTFSLAIILTIALGIGANTAMFSVIHSVLLQPLDYREPDRVVLVTEGATPVRFEEIKAASRSYSEVGAFANGLEDMALAGIGEPEVLKGARVSSSFLHILGVRPLLGRSFSADEDQP